MTCRDMQFIIHSDFDTSANRQDIVETSRRNLDLLDWIAKTFVDAILQFNQDETLDCEWPLFLPSTKHSSSWFWAGLNRRILEHVGKTPTVKSRRWTDLRLIHHVLFLTDDWRYGDGLPLLDDEASDPFLSPRYPQKSVDILFEYGLKRLGSDLQLALLEKDVGSFNSIMQATGTDEEWHTAMASCLSSIAAKDMPAARRMKSLPLLPLSTGLWASTISGPVYLPRAGGFNIPSHVSLRVIKPKALWNEARKVLFERLGVSEALVIIVRASIYEAFRITRPGQYHSDYNYYCRYLYFTHNSQPHSELCQIMVVCSAGKRVDPHVTDVYFSKADDPYGAKALLAPNDTAPGMPVSFLHDVFLATPLPRPSQDHPSWKGWLRRSVGIRQQLRLTTKDGKALSDAFLYVFQHRKDKFVGLLGHLWLSEGSKMRENKNLCRSVEDLDAQELCGVDYQLRLRDTWLPKPHLLSAVRRYMEHPEHFPFLKLDGAEVTGPSAMKCDFLRVYLSVGGQDDIDFSLEILRCIVKYCPAPLSVSQSQRVLDLYVVIDAKLLLVGDQPAKRKQIR